MSAKKITFILLLVIGVIAIALNLVLDENSIIPRIADVLISAPVFWYIFRGKQYDEEHKKN